MYNEKLNKQWVRKLRAEVAGKKILLVGNSASMFSEKLGEKIDSADFVIRFGKGVPYADFREYLGSKTDLWFFGMARAGMYHKFKNCKYKVVTLSQLPLYRGEDGGPMAVTHDMMNGKFQVYRDFFLAGSGKDTLECNARINGATLDARISQGAQCVHWLHNKVYAHSSIELVGFDFFGSSFTYNYDTKRENIKKQQITTSWHMPLASDRYEANPHNKGDSEEKYIRSIHNLHVHEMPPLDMEKIGEILRKLRGKAATIENTL